MFRISVLNKPFAAILEPLCTIDQWCTLGWSDIALFSIFENEYNAADQVRILL